MIFLNINNLNVSIEGKKILNDFNITINEGEVHAIMGPNGCSKSTLANVLAGNEDYEVNSGKVICKDDDLVDLNIEERDLEYEKSVQLKPHILYLAFSSKVKVGVTRKTQVPYRWIDQGAIQAIEIAEFPNRYLAGISEVELKNHYSDKTNWREMLKTSNSNVNLVEEREKAFKKLPKEALDFTELKNYNLLKIDYPVKKYPLKPKSLNIIKEKSFSSELVGVKGQYLIFKDDTVFNVRSNEGVIINLEILRS